MAASFVGIVATNITGASGTDVVLTVGAGGVPAGDTVAVFGSSANATASIWTVFDSQTNTWTPQTTALGARPWPQVFTSQLATALASGDTITLRSSTSGSKKAAIGLQFSGLDTVEDTSNQATGSSATPSSGNITTTNAGDALIAVCAINAPSTNTYTEDTTHSFTTAGQTGTTGGGGTANIEINGAYRIMTTTATLAHAPAIASAAWGDALAAMKPFVAAASVIPDVVMAPHIPGGYG